LVGRNYQEGRRGKENVLGGDYDLSILYVCV
jgi:hypothetical protein